MNSPAWHLAVLIPARNEEALLDRCLRSVHRACVAVRGQATTDVVLVVDSSDDATESIARNRMRNWGCVLRTNVGCVGAARVLAAERAFLRHGASQDLLWLANTDADCEVPESWLCEQLRVASAGWDAVAGIIEVDTFTEHEAHVPRRFRETYLLHENGTHPHVHGANLGVRGDAYLRAGGFGCLPHSEDHDLWARLRTSGSQRLLADAKVKVVTSGRRTGRAPRGFADALSAHNLVQL